MTAAVPLTTGGRTADDRTADTGVWPMLRRLAAERASGALTRDHGVLYLHDGLVTHAESSATPGLDVLLTTGGTVRPEGWWEAVDKAGPAQRVGRFLIDSGQLSAGALELCHLGALYDAAYFTLASYDGPTRFRHGVAHWIGPVRPVPVTAVERETRRRRRLLDRIWRRSATDTQPVRRAGSCDGLALPPRRRAVLDRVDGERTAADISLALGRPGFHTVVELRRLAAAGLVTATAPTVSPAPLPESGTGTGRGTGTVTETETGTRTATVLPPVHSPDQDIALLHRLKEALEAL